MTLTALILAMLICLALTSLIGAMVLVRARRSARLLAVPVPAVSRLVAARRSFNHVQAGAERGLWALTRFDDRADEMSAALLSRREQLDRTRPKIAGMSATLERVRSLASLIFDR